MKSIRYERLDARYAIDIARVHFESWQATYAGVLPSDYIDGPMRADIERIWVNWHPSKLGLGALDAQDQLLAIATYDMPAETGEAAYLDNFHVLPQFHGTGVARDLFVAGVEAVEADGASSLWLTVLDTNARARAFYAKMQGREGAIQDDEMLGYKVQSVPVHWDELQLIQKNNM